MHAGRWHCAHLGSFVMLFAVDYTCHIACVIRLVVEAAGLLAAGVPGTAEQPGLGILNLTNACKAKCLMSL